MAAPLKILQATHSPPDYIPPPILAPDQVVCGPQYPDQKRGDRVVSIKTPAGGYDIEAAWATLPANQRPDLFVARVDSSGVNLPRNTASLNCRRILLIGDTHHQAQPIRRLLAYAREEADDALVFDYTRQHAHFFIEAGLAPVYWLPGVNVRRIAVPPPGKTNIPFSFVGQAGKFHPRRRVLCQKLVDAGLPLKIMSAPSGQARVFHAKSRVNLNCSLNGDLNLRVFEVLASGGCLLTDRLGPFAGLDRLFVAGEHLQSYGDDGDCVAEARALLADPARAALLAKQGKAHYGALYSTERMTRDFLDLVEGKEGRPEFALTHDPRASASSGSEGLMERIALYEIVQAVHMSRESVKMTVAAGVDARFLSDCADLPRLQIQAAMDAARSAHLAAAGVAGLVGEVPNLEAVMDRPCDLLASTVAGWRDGATRDLLTRQPQAMLLLTDRIADPALDAELARAGLKSVAGDAPLYARGG